MRTKKKNKTKELINLYRQYRLNDGSIRIFDAFKLVQIREKLNMLDPLLPEEEIEPEIVK